MFVTIQERRSGAVGFGRFSRNEIDNIVIIAILANMNKKYRLFSEVPLKVQELAPVSATVLKNSTADVLDKVATEGAVAITRHDKPRAVLVSIEEFERLTGSGSSLLNELQAEYRGVLEKMQEPEQKAAAERAFNATSEGLGKAAVAAARKK